jgi:hypothetical protein
MKESKILQLFPTQLFISEKNTSFGEKEQSASQQLRNIRAKQTKQDEYKENGRLFISSIDRLRWQIEFLSGVSKVNRDSQIYSKIFQYIHLATQTEFSSKDNADFYQLCREAELNLELESWIEKIDDCITRLEFQPKRIFPGFQSLEGFLSDLRKINPDTMTLRAFTDLVQQVDIHEDLLNSHIPAANNKPFLKENIHNSRLVTISLMLWKPGGCIPAHEHQNSLSVIRVCKGTLSHWKNLPPNRIGTTSRREKIDFFQDELIAVDYNEHYELSNQQLDKDLLTLHFRFYRPSDDRDREGLYLSH